MKALVDTAFPCCSQRRRLEGKKIKVRRAPEPTDVIWPNICYTKWQKFKSRVITSFLTLFLVCCGFGLIVLISYGQNQAIENNGQNDSSIRALSVLASFAITFINTCLVIAIRKLAQYEKHATYTEYFAAVASKQSVVRIRDL